MIQGGIMLNYCFQNAEEELLHIIRVNGSTFEQYLKVIEKVENLNYTDDNDNSFLREAILQNQTEMALDLLRRGIDVNLQNCQGFTAAMTAASEKNWELLSEILKCNPNVNLKRWTDGNSLLYDLTVNGNDENSRHIAEGLLKMGANPHSQNHNGVSPLDIAVKYGYRELAEAFKQVEKPAQEDPEPFRIPRKARGYFRLSFKDYHKYILVENTSISYLEEKIKDYATICGGRKVPYAFEIKPVKDSPWTVLLCPKKMDFYNYHNLMSWIWGLPEDKNPPSRTVCAALHESDERLSYYGVMDKITIGDARLVGRFQNGESFSIYLPEAYKKDGNAQSYRDFLPITSIRQYLTSCGFDEAWLHALSEMPGSEIVVEMAV